MFTARFQTVKHAIRRKSMGPDPRCSVHAIDIQDAFEQAENAITKELGLYSLSSSRGQFLFNTGSEKPINTVLLAPHMTVHDATGAIHENIYWYNRWPKSLSERPRSEEEINAIANRAEKVRTKIKRLPWKGKAEMALARHYTAFSKCDLEASFLESWRLLEAIGGTSREKGETLVKRAAWFFEERDASFQTGLHLMHRRNLISHGRPVKDESNEALAFQMKQFLEPFLFAFLTNPFRFESLEEFWSFCDLPVNRKARIRKSYVLRSSIRFRRES